MKGTKSKTTSSATGSKTTATKGTTPAGTAARNATGTASKLNFSCSYLQITFR